MYTYVHCTVNSSRDDPVNRLDSPGGQHCQRLSVEPSLVPTIRRDGSLCKSSCIPRGPSLPIHVVWFNICYRHSCLNQLLPLLHIQEYGNSRPHTEGSKSNKKYFSLEKNHSNLTNLTDWTSKSTGKQKISKIDGKYRSAVNWIKLSVGRPQIVLLLYRSGCKIRQ